MKQEHQDTTAEEWENLGRRIREAAAGSAPSDQGRCDDEVYRKGRGILVLAGIGGDVIEAAISGMAKITGARIDWHFVGGRAVVKAIGDTDLTPAIDRLLAILRRECPQMMVMR